MSKKRIGAQTGKKYAVRFCFPVRGQGGGSSLVHSVATVRLVLDDSSSSPFLS